MLEVREKRGYAYSVYSYFLPLAQEGPFQIGLQTKKEQADEALARVRAVLDEFLAHGPSAAELKAAKQNLVGGFALRIDSNRKLLEQVALIGFYQLPLTWLDDFAAPRREGQRGRGPRRVRAARAAGTSGDRRRRQWRKLTRSASSAASGAAAASAFPITRACARAPTACAKRCSTGSGRT